MKSSARFAAPLLILLSTALNAQNARAQTAVERYGKLSVKGNQIVDKNGQPVQLRGMSLFWSQWMGKYYNAECIKWLRDDWNCNVVRAAIGVGSGGYLTQPDVEMKKVDTVVQAAIDLGIYVIIDWHAHDPEPEAAAKFFAQIAEKYGQHPNVIYETYNEPLKKYDWSTVIKPYHEKVVKAIREKDPDNLVILGTQSWSQDVEKAAADPVKGTNLAYTLHYYAATHKQFLRDKAQKALDGGIALFVTEWGTSEASGNGKLDDVETRKWWDFLDKNHISMCNWSVTDKNETSASLKPGADAKGGWKEDMISPSGKIVRAELKAKNP